MSFSYIISWIDVNGERHVSDVEASELGEALAHIEAHVEVPIKRFTGSARRLTSGGAT